MRDGVIGDFSVAENLVLVDSDKPACVALRVPAPPLDQRPSQELVETFDVRTPSIDTPTRNLSGGNIQKLILARELSGQPKVLLVAQPTRGIDVAAARYIHDRLREEARKGIAIVIISEDLDEVIVDLRPHPRDVRGSRDRRGGTRDHDAGGDRAHDGRRLGAGMIRRAGPPMDRLSRPRPTERSTVDQRVS